MRRRDLVAGIAAAAAGPFAVRAQQGERVKLIAVLISLADDNSQAQARYRAFIAGLRQLGWIDGQNVRIEVRWGSGQADRMRKHARELVSLAPDVIFASGGSSMAPLLEATRTVPIVFAQVTDPVGAGFVESLSQPGGNITGFASSDFAVSAKWLELLKQVAPGVARALVIRDTTLTVGIGQFAVLQSAAPSLGMELTPAGIRDAAEVERAVAAFARRPQGSLILTASALAYNHRDLILGLASRYRLPSIYFSGYFVTAGGLMSYGVDSNDMHRLAAGYVDRILKGAKAADLPVQAPTTFDLAINLKTAKALGLNVPEALLVAANEVIE
jgi:putative ABC transport system substrate-binding protein